jgi:ketosteroid isomerase-like protein
MSAENVEFIRRAFEEQGIRPLDETAEMFWHPDVEYVEDPRWPGASTYKGRDAVRRCFERYLEALGPLEDFTITVERVFEASGGRLVPFIRYRGRASSSGAPHEHLWGYVVEVSEGRIIYFRAYYEPDEALEAVGVGPTQ